MKARKCFAIGDIHGDCVRMLEILESVGLVDSTGHWQGENSSLVFTGDYVDRGPESYRTVKTVMRLQEEAKEVGGEVLSLLGNHDALMVSIALSLRAGQSHRGRTFWFERNGGHHQAAHLFSADNDAILWLQSLLPKVKIGKVLFQHCDSTSLYLKNNFDLSDDARAYTVFEEMTDARHWDARPGNLDSYLKDCGAELVVHGHTRHLKSTPKPYLDGKAVNIDGSLSCGYRSDPDRGFVYRIPKRFLLEGGF